MTHFQVICLIFLSFQMIFFWIFFQFQLGKTIYKNKQLNASLMLNAMLLFHPQVVALVHGKTCHLNQKLYQNESHKV